MPGIPDSPTTADRIERWVADSPQFAAWLAAGVAMIQVLHADARAWSNVPF
jgi:hypothetical protein